MTMAATTAAHAPVTMAGAADLHVSLMCNINYYDKYVIIIKYNINIYN